MKVETFFEKFELFADAPDAMAKMREIILDNAVNGNLSAPRSSDTWRSVKLGDLIAKGLKSIDPNSFPTQTFELWSVPSFESGEPEIVTGSSIGSTKRSIPDGSILLGKINPHLNRVWRVSRRTKHPLIASPEWIVVIPTEDWDSNYLARILASPSFNRKICATAQGMGSLTRANTRMAALIELKHPPLAEQKRIVAKVDELMALCDRLETQQQERETRHAALVRASLARFTEAPTPANLQFLFHPSYDVPPADLRKTILTLAVQGKLIPQDPNDEPAEEILRRIKAKQPTEVGGAVDETERPWSIPRPWQWVRLGYIANIKHGYAFSSDSFTSDPTPYVLTTPGNFYESGGFRDRGSSTKYFKGEIPPPFVLNAGDLIIPMTEQAAGLLGSPAFIPSDGRTYLHNQRLGKLEFYSDEVLPEFVFWFFNCEFFRGELARTCTGMKVRHTSPKRILVVPFPLPPLAEQRRIVAKVEELMALVDELEQQLAASRATAEKLLTALVAGITSEPSPVGSNGTHTARGSGEESLEEEYALCPC